MPSFLSRSLFLFFSCSRAPTEIPRAAGIFNNNVGRFITRLNEKEAVCCTSSRGAPTRFLMDPACIHRNQSTAQTLSTGYAATTFKFILVLARTLRSSRPERHGDDDVFANGEFAAGDHASRSAKQPCECFCAKSARRRDAMLCHLKRKVPRPLDVTISHDDALLFSVQVYRYISPLVKASWKTRRSVFEYIGLATK